MIKKFDHAIVTINRRITATENKTSVSKFPLQTSYAQMSTTFLRNCFLGKESQKFIAIPK